MKIKKLFATIAAGSLMLTLAACGSSSSQENSQSSPDVSSSKVTKKHTEKSDKVANKKTTTNKEDGSNSSANDATSSSQNDSSSTSTNSSSSTKYSVSGTSSLESGEGAKSTVKQNSSTSSQATMTATDARNIVKEHIGNQLNNRGIAGQSTSDLPSIDSVDGYTATQNGTNNWTVSGNGHTYHVTANSVTEN